MEDKKVAIDFFWIINGQEGFGISRATRSLANQMRNNGKSIIFLSISKGGLVEALQKEGFKVQCLNLDTIALFKKSTVYFITSFLKNINLIINTYQVIRTASKNYDYDVLIYRSPNLTLFVSLLKNPSATKVFLMPNVIGNNYFLNINKYLYLLFSLYGRINIIGNSRYTASTITGLCIKPYVLHLGVNSNDFKPNQHILSRKKIKIHKNDIVYGVFARLNYAKAQDLIILAFSRLIENHPNSSFKLLLVGLGNKDTFYEQCSTLINSCGLKDKVIIIKAQKDIIPYYSLVDVMINSRRDAEPFGLTVVESMLMQKPIIALGLGGPSETIIDNQTGWLVTRPTVDAYYKTMETSFTTKDKWIEIGKNGRKHALKNFTIETVYTNLMGIINDIKK